MKPTIEYGSFDVEIGSPTYERLSKQGLIANDGETLNEEKPKRGSRAKAANDGETLNE